MPNASLRDSITALWVRDAQHLWQVQETLLQNYRTYLIVLNSLLAAGSCTIMVRLYGVITEDRSQKLNVLSVGFILVVIMILLLALFIGFAFRSIQLMSRVILNRGYNVHLCQYVILELQSGKFFREALPNLSAKDLAKISLLSAFKIVEHPEKKEKGFGSIGKNQARLGDFLWAIKGSKCQTDFDETDFSRRSIYLLLKWMFYLIWGLISSFWLLAAGWLICRSTGTFYLLHPCPCRLLA
jgi:hypothetical protein